MTPTRPLLPILLLFVFVAPAASREEKHPAAPQDPTPAPATIAATAIDRHAKVGPHGVGRLAHTVLRDPAREKDVQVRVTYPEHGGTHPVLIWSHGAYGSKEAYGPLVDHWASHGYVVIQATHYDSLKLGMPGDLSRVFQGFADRPKDVTFLLDNLATLRKRLEGYAGRFDVQAIGVGGHSFGAHTSQLIGGVTTVAADGARTVHRDARAKAVLLLSPQGRGGELDETSYETLTVPAMIVTGTRDNGRKGHPFTWRLEPFTYAPAGSKHAVLVEGARHSFGGITGKKPNRRTGPAVKSHVDAVKATSLLFWHAHVRSRDGARTLLASSRLQQETAGAVRVTSK